MYLFLNGVAAFYNLLYPSELALLLHKTVLVNYPIGTTVCMYLDLSLICCSVTSKNNLEVPGQRPQRPNRKYGTVQQPRVLVQVSPGSTAFLNAIDSKFPNHSPPRRVRKWSAPCFLGCSRKKSR